VIANPAFGFQVSESGSGYSWSENSRENQLTPWSNDPVDDPTGEAIYVRDDDSGELWGPTALPIRTTNPPTSRARARLQPLRARRDGIASTSSSSCRSTNRSRSRC
jgi:cyclic beta-1,2-glucan synthetase